MQNYGSRLHAFELILGSAAFVGRILRFLEGRPPAADLPQLLALPDRPALDRLLTVVAKALGDAPASGVARAVGRIEVAGDRLKRKLREIEAMLANH